MHLNSTAGRKTAVYGMILRAAELVESVEWLFYRRSVAFYRRERYIWVKEGDILNQEKTGNYIAEKRKQLGMTQKQLAEQVGLTDKAVSKWERGKSIPDSAMIGDLCRILHISVNEFLSGEDIEKESYPDKAEENMRVLMKEHNSQKKNARWIIASITFGFILMLVGLAATFINSQGLHMITYFIDMPSLLFLLGIDLIVLVLSGAVIDFFRSFAICFGKGKAEDGQATKSIRAVKLMLVLNVLAGVFIFAGQFILTMPVALESGTIPQVISMLTVTVWYSIFWDLLLLPVLFRLQNKKEESGEK